MERGNPQRSGMFPYVFPCWVQHYNSWSRKFVPVGGEKPFSCDDSAMLVRSQAGKPEKTHLFFGTPFEEAILAKSRGKNGPCESKAPPDVSPDAISIGASYSLTHLCFNEKDMHMSLQVIKRGPQFQLTTKPATANGT